VIGGHKSTLHVEILIHYRPVIRVCVLSLARQSKLAQLVSGNHHDGCVIIIFFPRYLVLANIA